ncbi:MAG: hypothetical protein AVDCRST_MAG64-2401, partial [uncultured Phycisphaerae bacterium]
WSGARRRRSPPRSSPTSPRATATSRWSAAGAT